MKKTLLPLLVFGLVCCTPQEQANLQVSITTNDTIGRDMTIGPMGNYEAVCEMPLTDGSYSANLPTSPTGFYSLVSVKGQSQSILPFYVPTTRAKASAQITFGERGAIEVNGSRDNEALAAYTMAYTAGNRALWNIKEHHAIHGRAILERFITDADSIAKVYKCSAPVQEYLKLWGYMNAYDNYTSLQRIMRVRTDEMPFHRNDLLPEAHTLFDTPLAALFPNTTAIVIASIPEKDNLPGALSYVEQHYTDSTLKKKVMEGIATRYVNRYDYAQGYEQGLECLQQAIAQYELEPQHATNFAKRRCTVPGQPFPTGIVLKDREGRTVDFATFKGKYVYIDMWASWCVPCLREVPVLQQLEKKLKNKKVEFVSISIDASEEAWKNKLVEKNMHGHQLWNPGSTLGEALGVRGIPFFAIYDPDGNLYIHGAPRPSQGAGLVELLEGLK